MDNPGSGPSQTPTPRRIPVLFSPDGPYPLNNVGKPAWNWLPWAVAIVAVGCLLGLVFWFGQASSKANDAGMDSYARYLVVSHLHIGQANNFAGNPLVYVEGTLKNRGNRTVTSVEMQALFPNDAGDPPRMDEAPVFLLLSRQSYVETEPLDADPLLPGMSRNFRLTFANVSSTWNQKVPQLQVLRVETKAKNKP